MGISEIQECFVSQKSIFDPFGKKLPACRVTVKDFKKSRFRIFDFSEKPIH